MFAEKFPGMGADFFCTTYLNKSDMNNQFLSYFILLMEEKEMVVKIDKKNGTQENFSFTESLQHSRSPRDGRFIEEIGTFDPSTDPSTFKINEDLAKKWLQNGAQPTEQVAKLFKVAGIEK